MLDVACRAVHDAQALPLWECQDIWYPLNCMVLMLNPKVGLIVVMSSLFKRFTIVVLPALSKPLQLTVYAVGWMQQAGKTSM